MNESDREKRGPARVDAAGRSRARAIGWALLALLGAGCAAGRQAQRSSSGGPPPRDQPTVGTDFRTVPPGQTIPPAGLGVDLVHGQSGGKRDPATINASAPGVEESPSLGLALRTEPRRSESQK